MNWARLRPAPPTAPLGFNLLLCAGGCPPEVYREVSTDPRDPPPAARMEFVKCLGRPEEFYNLLRFQMGGRRKVIPKMDQVGRASLHPGWGGAAARGAGPGAWPTRPKILGGGCGERVPNASGALLPSGRQTPAPSGGPTGPA